MIWVELGLGAVAVAVLVANALTTRRLWSSAAFERPQKVAQTTLMWLVPGSFAAVRYFLAEPHRRPTDDSSGGEGSFDASDYDVPAHGHHGGHDGYDGT